jgi:putative phosphoesterase
MRIGLLSDAHGNPLGTRLCLDFLQEQGAHKLYFLGDAVGYFPLWREVLQLLEERSVECQLGNHDDMVLRGELDDDEHNAYRHLPALVESLDRQLNWMRRWPRTRSLEIDGCRILLVHGSPTDALEDYVYPWSDLRQFAGVDADAVFMGHTHRPFIAEQFGKLIVNVGSCGLPRDAGALASCALFDSATRTCTIHRLPFDADVLLAQTGPVHESVEQCLRRPTAGAFGQQMNGGLEE